MADPSKTTAVHRMHVVIRGAVQGVGFRPFIYRLAQEFHLTGWVNNSPTGVFIEVEGPQNRLDEFLLRIDREKPPNAFIQSLEYRLLDPHGYTEFIIQESEAVGEKSTLILPDMATCPECLKEIFDPGNRRYLYPFTNCTHCGPRFSIIEALPYDRHNTTMKKFTMCRDCQGEYENPVDRRFHAQPNACPDCGPHLELWYKSGATLASHQEALLTAVEAIRQGQIVAVKGLGGFHLMADARNDKSVQQLRNRKHREEKPFALMFPDLNTIQQYCEVSKMEARLLQSPESPIVLLRRRIPPAAYNIAPSVAPGNPYLGIMLPYTPLHHILMKELGFPVVATSGNLSDEPICTDEHEALKRLGGIADWFLIHNRPIVHHVDDSIVRIVQGRELVLRRARGYAPLPLLLAKESPSLLAVGAHLKNTIAVGVQKQVFISQHIGDLETEAAHQAFQKTVTDFTLQYEIQPVAVACDAHPDYLSTRFARQSQWPVIQIQHHYAHVLACMAENELAPPFLGVSWDGTGYGLDGTVWGGEFFRVTDTAFQRLAHFRLFPLPGGERAIREPRRAALGLLYQIRGGAVFTDTNLLPLQSFTAKERGLLQQMLKQRLNTPLTSSAGRLFDAVAALIGLRQINRFEGQAALELEFQLPQKPLDAYYPFSVIENTSDKKGKPLVINWENTVEEILSDYHAKIPISIISEKFHNMLAEVIMAVAKHFRIQKVVLSGGCFQNKYLTERTIRRLKAEGFCPYWHQRIPPNDGGISAGQIIGAARVLQAQGLNFRKPEDS